MSKFLIVLSLLFGCAQALAYDIDLSGGRAEITGNNSIVLNNVKFGGISAVWAKLVWNPELNAFKLVEFGDDSGKSFDTSLAGSWSLSFDWGCDGTYATSTWSIYEDGTCTDSVGNACLWTYDNGQFTLDYGRSVGAFYSGMYNRTYGTLQGTMSYNGVRGCWSATRLSPQIKSPKQDSPNVPKQVTKPSSPLRP